jgi:hypothetical protein
MHNAYQYVHAVYMCQQQIIYDRDQILQRKCLDNVEYLLFIQLVLV